MEGRIKLSGFLIGGSVVCAMVTTQYKDGYFFMGNFFYRNQVWGLRQVGLRPEGVNQGSYGAV